MHWLLPLLQGLVLVAGLSGAALAGSAERGDPAPAPIPGEREAPSVPLHGLNFSPYQAGQDPARGTVIGAAQIEARLRIVRPHTRWIRTYGSTQGLQRSGRIARGLGLKAALGAWLSADRAANEREIAQLIAAIQAGDAELAIVGSEVLLRRDLGEAELIAYIERVRRASGGVPVAYAEVRDGWLAHPAVAAAVDVVLAHYYPYWEGVPVERAVAVLDGWHRQVTAAVGKPVWVGETGWPSGGAPVGAAVPSLENAGRYLREFLAWARANHVEYFYFAAFDEGWKAAHEGPQGAHWGLWDQQGRLKPELAAVLVEATQANNVLGGGSPGVAGKPRIEFTVVPPYGEFGDLEGRVMHVDPAGYRVAVYIAVGGWWNKPAWNRPLTPIASDGRWRCAITTGGHDERATRIVAFLLPAGFDPPLLAGNATLPAILEATAVAWIEVGRHP